MLWQQGNYSYLHSSIESIFILSFVWAGSIRLNQSLSYLKIFVEKFWQPSGRTTHLPSSIKQKYAQGKMLDNFKVQRKLLTLQMTGGGQILPGLKKNCIFGTFLWSKWPKKIWLFPNIYDNASHTLLEAQNGLKKGFYSIQQTYNKISRYDLIN